MLKAAAAKSPTGRRNGYWIFFGQHGCHVISLWRWQPWGQLEAQRPSLAMTCNQVLQTFDAAVHPELIWLAPVCLVVVPYLAFVVAAVVRLVLVVSFVAACVCCVFPPGFACYLQYAGKSTCVPLPTRFLWSMIQFECVFFFFFCIAFALLHCWLYSSVLLQSQKATKANQSQQSRKGTKTKEANKTKKPQKPRSCRSQKPTATEATEANKSQKPKSKWSQKP